MTLDAFGSRELDVLRVLWQRGPSTVAEVREALDASLAYTTVLTVLRNLEAKEAVGHEEEGKAHRYFARLEHAEAQRSAVGSMVERLFDGRLESLMTHLVDARGLSDEEMRRLHALLGSGWTATRRRRPTARSRNGPRDASGRGEMSRMRAPMIAAWMSYAVLVSAALALAARAAEWGLERRGVSLRWLWVIAVVGALALPAWRWTEAKRGVAPSSGIAPLVRLPQIVIGSDRASPAAWVRSLDALLLTGWGIATLLLLLRRGAQRRQLHIARRTWQRTVVDGHPVLLSPDAGPAVIGGRDASIVLPRWVLALPTPTRALILQHEREHLRAGDAWLQDAVRLVRSLVPWNPVLWYVERRLRAAIEVDCDRPRPARAPQ